MSNYINVLRRLERERREPASVPVGPVTSEPLAREAGSIAGEAHPVGRDTAPIVAREAAPIATPSVATPLVRPSEPQVVAPAVAAVPASVERTVIPLPSVPGPTPVAVTPSTAAVAVPAPAAPTPVVAPDPAGIDDTRRARAFAPPTHPGIATLLDAIRLIANGRRRRMVVFCGASNAEEVVTLADALVMHAVRSGMPAFLASLTRTATGAALVPARGTTMEAVLPIGLNGTPSADALSEWAEQVGPSADLVVITGPPLASSIDAALLACAADGLVIVAESEVTERAALQLAAERARIAGCKTLGVVMHGSKNRLPGWLSRLLGDRSESQSF